VRELENESTFFVRHEAPRNLAEKTSQVNGVKRGMKTDIPGEHGDSSN